MKYLYTFFCMLLMCMLAKAQTDDIPFALTYADICLANNAPETAQSILQSIEDACKHSNVWQDRCTYFRLHSELYPEGSSEALADMKQACLSLPDHEKARPYYLETVCMYCEDCFNAGLYDECEEMASRALVKSISIADSCHYASGLFSLLARCYEQRKDSVQTGNMHFEALISSMRFNNRANAPDSAEILDKRQLQVFQGLQENSQRQGQKCLTVADILIDIANMAFQSGNVTECIWTGEKALGIYEENKQEVPDHLGHVYSILASEYACLAEITKLDLILPKALAFNLKHPNGKNDGAYLYADVGINLADRTHFKEALVYLKKARTYITRQHPQSLIEMIDRYITRCNESL